LRDITNRQPTDQGIKHQRSKCTAGNERDEPNAKRPRNTNSGICNWCGHSKELVPGKKFVRHVAKMGGNVDGVIVLFPNDFTGKEMTCVTLVSEEEQIAFKMGETQ